MGDELEPHGPSLLERGAQPYGKSQPRIAMIAEEGEDAREDDRDHHQLRVAVADVGELVREHGLELVVGQRVEQAARHRHDVAGPRAGPRRRR